MMFADALQVLLEAQRDLKVVGRATNGHDAVRSVRRLRPDVAVACIALPGMNGIDATSRVREVSPSTHVVVLSASSSQEFVHRALHAGAMGFLSKEASGADLVAAVRSVANGKRYLSRKVTAAIVHDYVGMKRSASPLESLTIRERHVLQLVVEGKSSAEISAVLSLSGKTVDTYRSRVKQKLGINDIAGLVKFAIRQGITPAD